jgi:hypothetical protein
MHIMIFPLVLAHYPEKVGETKNLFCKKRLTNTTADCPLIFQKSFCRNWHLVVRQVVEASSGRSLRLSG